MKPVLKMSEKEELAYGPKPITTVPPTPAPRDLMKQVVFSPPSGAGARDPATLEDQL